MISQDPLIGKLFANRYRIDSARSGGSQVSTVYDATDVRSRDRVILRVSTAESLVDLDAGIVDTRDAIELFKRQTQMLASLAHPSLASINDWGTQPVEGTQFAFTVLEYYSGGTLREILDRGRRLTPSQAMAVGLDVCRALNFLHSKGWVHGDVRPANIFLGDDSRVRLAGLGSKRVVNASQMSIEQASYAAPEIASGQQPSAQSDVYSLALTLLELITGLVPFVGETTAITLATRVDKLLPVSADLGPIAVPIERAGRPNASERFSAIEFGRAFASIAEKMPMPLPIEALESKSFETVIEKKVADQTGEIKRPNLTGVLEDQQLLTTDGDEMPLFATRTEVKRHKRFLAIGAAIALLVVGFIGFQTFVKQSHIVPSFVGTTEGEARNLLASLNWTVVVTTERSDDIAVGAVIRTEPRDGVSLQEGKTLTLVISEGPALVRLPDLAGMDGKSAVGQLTSIGLAATQQLTPSEDVPAGIMISWAVPEQPGLAPGQEVLRGTAIDVLVSSGPAPRDVPLIVGMTVEQAQALANDQQLILVMTPPALSNAAPAGLIAAQSPPPGQKADRGSNLVYSVSLGPDLVKMPKIVGQSFAKVEPMLTDAGFVVGKVTGKQNYKLRKAFVAGKQVATGDQVPRGATVDLVFP